MKDNAVIPFKSNAGISYALTQRLLDKGKQYGLTAIFPFNPEKVTVESFGIDVIGTLHNLETNSKVARHKSEDFNYYSIILLE